MHTGDLVANGEEDTALWPIFLRRGNGELLRKAAFFPLLGNHDRNAPNYYEYLKAKPYYSFDWGTAHFSVIDSDIGNVGASQGERDAFWLEETNWLQADLRDAAKSDLRFVFAHHPPITAVKRRQGDNPHMIALEPMFEEYNVTAAFFGHDHNYQHYLKNGVHYFTTGGGGAPLYDVDMPPARNHEESGEHREFCGRKSGRWQGPHRGLKARRRDDRRCRYRPIEFILRTNLALRSVAKLWTCGYDAIQKAKELRNNLCATVCRNALIRLGIRLRYSRWTRFLSALAFR